jgi:hypothetical protein
MDGQNQHEIAAAYLKIRRSAFAVGFPSTDPLTRAKRWFAGDGEVRCFPPIAPGRRLPVLGENARWAGDAVRLSRYLPT